MMRRFLVLLSLAFIFFVGAVAWLFVVIDSPCGNRIAAEVPSPDGRHRAILFERNCGATTDFTTGLSITKASADLPNESGNVLIADGSPEDGLLTIRWDGPRTLAIAVHPIAEIFLSETRVEGIAIRYKPVGQGD